MRGCLLKKLIQMKARNTITQMLRPENGKSRLRRSLDACTLDFMVQSFKFVGSNSFSLGCNQVFSLE